MIAPAIIEQLLELVQLATAGAIGFEEFSKRLVDVAFATGIAPALLSDYVTASGKRYAEAAADIAEEAKLAVQRMKSDA